MVTSTSLSRVDGELMLYHLRLVVVMMLIAPYHRVQVRQEINKSLSLGPVSQFMKTRPLGTAVSEVECTAYTWLD